MSPLVLLLAVHLGPIAPGAPARQPQLAANGSSVGVAFGAGNAIYYSASPDGGSTFSAPVKVAEAGSLMLGRHRGPRIAAMGNSIVITAVMGPPVAAGLHVPARSPGGDLVSWHSTDGGKTWSDGALVNDVPAAANEGLHALGSDGHGKIFAAWLDKRSGHGTRLYGASSTNGITWSKNVLIYESPDGTICECCHPSVGIDSKGQIVVMWRNALGGNRDLYLARSADGVKFSKAEKLGTGSWKLNACPMDGGGIAISGDRIVTAWRREHDLFLASPGGAETRLGSGMDVGIAGDARGVYAIWSSPSGIQAATAGKAPVTLAASGAFPTIVALADGRVLAAWEEDGKISIQPVR